MNATRIVPGRRKLTRRFSIEAAHSLKMALTTAGVLIALVGPSVSQTPPPPAAAPTEVNFNVVSVRSSTCDSHQVFRGGANNLGAIAQRGVTLLNEISTAYQVPASEVFGGPSWLATRRFDVYARAMTPTTSPQMNAELLTILSERFGVVTHREDRMVPGYALRLGAGKPQMKVAAGDGPAGCRSAPNASAPGAFTYTCRSVNMVALARILMGAGGYLGDGIAADETDLPGAFDFTLTYRNQAQLRRVTEPDFDPGVDISIFDAVDKQLGLKLEPTLRPASVLVVDRVDPEPKPDPAGVFAKLPEIATEFEVASVKPTDPAAAPLPNRYLPSGDIEMHRRSLRDLIVLAYGVNADEVVGAPGWLDAEKFDIQAKTTANMNEVRAAFAAHGCSDSAFIADDNSPWAPMLRGLLAKRFELAVHKDVRTIPVLALVAAAQRPALKKTDSASRSACEAGSALGVRTYTCQNTTMAQLAEALDDRTGEGLAGLYTQNRAVIDATGLKGGYDFTLTWSPLGKAERTVSAGPEGAAAPTGDLTLYEALRKQLGLNLTPQKHPMPVLVIDHIERTPTPN